MKPIKLYCLMMALLALSSTPALANPNIADKTATLSIPVVDILSVLVLDGETNCFKGKAVVSGAAYNYNCVTVAPYSMDVRSETLGISKTYQAQYTIPLTGISTTKDLTRADEKAKLHQENMAKIKTYFQDLKSGCMGKTAILNWNAHGDLDIKTEKVLGEFRCKTNKTFDAGADSAVSFYDNAKESVKKSSKSVADHASRIANRADEMQKDARKSVAQKLKELGEKVNP